MLGLGRTLGMEILAEGVETSEQRDFLRSEGSRLGQGFLYVRPMLCFSIVRSCLDRTAGQDGGLA